MMSNPILVGVLNITPDSFSDGGRFLNQADAFKQALQLVEQGADLIDIGGDSTRPGSQCVGSKEEWRRVQPILDEFPKDIAFAIDTHHSEVAQHAISAGAVMINDVSAGYDPDMFSVLSKAPLVKYVMMYSRCTSPHQFAQEGSGDILEKIKKFFTKKIDQALQAGIKRAQLILDPGMGKFISDSPEVSWQVIRRINELTTFGLPLYFGSSRKGFLKLPFEEDLLERDLLSSHTGKIVENKINQKVPLYIRTHNVSLQKKDTFN